jgi:hypothetical protein
MIANAYIALALGAAMMIGGVATVSALGNMNGDCDQIQDQLKDGTGDNCDCPCADDVTTDDATLADETVADDATCDSCLDYDYLYDHEFLYNETELDPPYSSACGQE